MKKIALIAIVIATFLFIACLPCQAQQVPWVCPNDDEVNGLYWICNYFPLNPNTQWQYTTGEYHVVNSIRTCSSGYSGILYATDTYEYSPYMQNGEHGLLFPGCQYDEGEFEDGGTHFVLVPPSISIGEVVRILTDERGTMDVEFVALETITVPAGTFSTLKMQWTRQPNAGGCSYKTTLWLAKGIGPVKIHRTDANPADCLGCMFVCDPDNNIVGLNTPAELISFDLKQGTPKISVRPMSVNLGSVKAGSTSNPTMVTIKNTGNGTLVINSITITGTNQSEFIESDNCSIVPAKSSCPITVTFAPLPPFAKKTALMSISSNDPKKPIINVNLSGQAPPPKISGSPMSVNLGSVAVGIRSASKLVTIENTGLSDLTINAITFGGTNAAEFGETNNCTTLSNGSSCTISVSLNPTSEGIKAATMSVSSNDPKKPVINVKLSGKGGIGGGGGVWGTVIYEGGGLPGVKITLTSYNVFYGTSSTRTTTTDSNGNYRFVAGCSYCNIDASKYGYKIIGAYADDSPAVNFTATSCQEECPVVELSRPENNFTISKSSSSNLIWDYYEQAVILKGNLKSAHCGGASLIDFKYVIDGQTLDQVYDGPLNWFLCWDGDDRQDLYEACHPIPTIEWDYGTYLNFHGAGLQIAWRSPSTGSHTWSIKATNLYSGCTATSEVRTFVIVP